MDPFVAPRRRGLTSAARSVGRYLVRGLSLLSYANPAAIVGAELYAQPGHEPAAAPPCLPPSHPECLVPDLAPSPVERQLWAQLRSGGNA